MGEVTVAWSAVTSLKSEEPLTVELPGGKSATGPVTVASGNLEVDAEKLPQPQVTAIRNGPEQAAFERMLHPGLLQLWAGTVDVGLSAARGNAKIVLRAVVSDAAGSRFERSASAKCNALANR